MRQYGTETLCMIIVGALAAYFLPWWSIVVAAAVVALFLSKKNIVSYAAGFTAGAMIWGTWAYLIDGANQGILSARMGSLMGGLSSLELTFATAFIAALLMAMGALSGASLQRLIKFQKK